MTHRRPDPRQRDLEDILRRALHTAAGSIDPAADGIELIRGRIAARRRAQVSWGTADLAGSGGFPARHLELARLWLRSALGAVVDRFRPSRGRPGWYGWLRPAAGFATAIFVVVAGYWALTALPQVIAPSANNGPGPGSVGTVPTSSSSAGSASQQGGTPSPSGRAHSSGSPSCTPNPSSSGSPSPSPSSTPSPTASPTPSPTGSPTGTPSPTGSPTGSPSPTVSATGLSSAGPSPAFSSVSGSTANRAVHARRMIRDRAGQTVSGVPDPKVTAGPGSTRSPAPTSSPC